MVFMGVCCRPEVLALSSLKHGSGLPVQTEFDVERVQGLVRLQQEEDQVRRLEPGDQERQETVARILGERQELEWRARQERTADTRGHRETALDGYIKVSNIWNVYSSKVLLGKLYT